MPMSIAAAPDRARRLSALAARLADAGVHVPGRRARLDTIEIAPSVAAAPQPYLGSWPSRSRSVAGI
ncbi:hypothetical protein [Phreatobacter sp. AB_2022a]|uniref:hypothetical protein n=1 Tax=Phreatobacter sp. AB_2022a TaxID=3003134 RepID=UPI0022874CEB|nr:hypothetical protein [Phreatobacter sp. AB_2022a]MCZ0733151.1 hypothetical protein [Phreatobacter sp. AB_2022a]